MAEARSSQAIQVRGARVHNLQNLDVDIPLQALTVVTGVSGSGKSSLAFDTIYAEGQRRYVESLSAYARQFLERMEKPDVDAVEGIAPAVAIRQKAGSRNPRSTVATSTEIYDYLRLLYARVGVTYCPDCDLAVERNDVDSAAAAALLAAPGARALVLFPVGPAEDSTALRERLAYLRGQGFNRLWQAGKMVEFSTPESLLELDLTQLEAAGKDSAQSGRPLSSIEARLPATNGSGPTKSGEPLFALVDRLVLEPDARSRLVDAIEIAYREAGEAHVLFPAAAGEAAAAPLRFNQRFECKRCGRKFETPEPRMFSFNNPFGACPRCQGFSMASEIAESRVVPDPGKSLNQGAIEPWSRPRFSKWREAMLRFARTSDIPLDRPWRDLKESQRRQVWEGAGKFPGVQGFFQRLETKKYKIRVRVFLSRYREYVPCPVCHGARLRPEALWVQLRSRRGRMNLAQATALTVEEAHAFFQELELTPEQTAIASAVLLEVRRRLEFLMKVGLEYLSLERQAGTLSGGEAQRIQLATALGSQLVGSLYVLDEPSIGLHPRDTSRLITILRELRDLGNTILVVEHDPEIMRASDHLLDLGPAAGEMGGRLVAQGTWREVAATKASLTGQYLRGERTLPLPSLRRQPGRRLLTVTGATLHNLRNLDLEIPLQMLVAVTGVSGSGKSTLVHDVLYANLKKLLRPGEDDATGSLTGCRSITGTAHLGDVVLVDQSPIGRTPRSNPVTYMKAFDGIRELFALQPAARRMGLRAGHFSFNVPGGRCETCQGDGVVTVDMQFLADVELVCEECGGTRYQARLLEVEYNGRNIHQVLQLSVHEALGFFAKQPRIVKPLQLLEEIGLGYLRLGQSATTLSGGEAQRLKLAAHLAQPRAADRTLFLFDEPTTGLHFEDIARLLQALQRLIEAGGSVLVIEHNLEVIKAADWVLDLGPEGGPRGGRLVAEGPPEHVAQVPASLTGRFLAPLLLPAPQNSLA